ncbi:MAG: fibronectin type III domain-containing protein [Bacteroidota bacterium]
MKKNLQLLLLLLCVFTTGYAQTNVGGTIASNTTWDLAGSPYIVVNGITIDSAITLTIMPGVQVKYNGWFPVCVNGTIRAIGTPDSLIEFKSNLFIPNYYPGLYFSPSAPDYDFNTGTGNFLQYCKFLKAGYSGCNLALYGAIESDSATPYIDNCIFDDCYTVWEGNYLRGDFRFTNNKVLNTTIEPLFNCSFVNPNKEAVFSCNLFKDNEISSPMSAGFVIGGLAPGRYINFSNNFFVSNNISTALTVMIYKPLNFHHNTMYNNNIGIGYFIVVMDTFQHNLFANNSVGEFLDIRDSLAVITNNNFLFNDTVSNFGDYLISNIIRQWYFSQHINGTSNYWGTTDTAVINDLIYDYYDDTSHVQVDYLPVLTAPDIDAPISPVQNLTRINLTGNNVQLSWDPNPESDIAGYRIYWGGYTGYSFTQQLDVGNVTTYTLSGVANSDSMAVTAYDVNSTTYKDFCSGQESWFSMPRLTAVGVKENAQQQVKIIFQPNPFSKYTVAKIPGNFTEKDFDFILSDATGRIINKQSFKSSVIKLYRNNLMPGIYFYRLTDKKKNILANGKLIVSE